MPALEQLNIRVTPAVKEKFRARALREGMSQAQLLGALLKQKGTLPRPDPVGDGGGTEKGSGPPATASPPDPVQQEKTDSADFVIWLSGRLGIPRALVRSAIRRGAVHVSGVPWTSEQIPKSELARPISYDGQPV